MFYKEQIEEIIQDKYELQDFNDVIKKLESFEYNLIKYNNDLQSKIFM